MEHTGEGHIHLQEVHFHFSSLLLSKISLSALEAQVVISLKFRICVDSVICISEYRITSLSEGPRAMVEARESLFLLTLNQKYDCTVGESVVPVSVSVFIVLLNIIEIA